MGLFVRHARAEKNFFKLVSLFLGSFRLGHRFGDKLGIIRLFIWWKGTEKMGRVFSRFKPPQCFNVRFQGRVFKIDVLADLSFPQSFYEVFIRQDYRHPALKLPKTILDVGANCGLASIFFNCLYPQATIYAFEPCRKNFSALKINTGSFENIRPLNLGLFSRNGSMMIDVSNRGGNNSFYGRGLECEKVNVSRLDDFLRYEEIERVDLLKIDAEGAEAEILTPAGALDRISVLIGEIHPHLIDADELLATLGKHFDLSVTMADNPMFYGMRREPRPAEAAACC